MTSILLMEFQDAIGTLHGMFPALSPQTLATVLEAHSGHMERSVDYLLSLSPEDSRLLSQQAPAALGPPNEPESDARSADFVNLFAGAPPELSVPPDSACEE